MVNPFRWAAAGRKPVSRPFGTAESDRRFTAHTCGPLWPYVLPNVPCRFYRLRSGTTRLLAEKKPLIETTWVGSGGLVNFSK